MRTDDETSSVLWWLLAVVILLRLATLGLYPLTDTTEARYAEIARVMLSTGDWITPQLEPNVPFWGKPPLYAWLTAASFKLFGLNEFAARLPHFLSGIATLALVWHFVASSLGRRFAQQSVLVLASTFIFFVAAGAVMTDMTLLFCVTLSMTGFWFAVHRQSAAWSLACFAGIGLGLLAKGPVAVILIALPLLLWLGVYRRFRLLANLRWWPGIALILVLALPWYLLAESKTPGFLNYFIVGEHFMRFLQPGWDGDLYGSAHDRPVGTIWLFWLLAALPWAPVFILKLGGVVRRREFVRFISRTDAGHWHGYLLCWMISPLLFFTFAGNILPAYVLPGIPAFSALLVAMNACGTDDRSKRVHAVNALSLAAPALFVSLLVFHETLDFPMPTEKNIIKVFQSLRSNPDVALYYLDRKPLSAAFYSRGQARLLEETSEPDSDQVNFWLAVSQDGQSELDVIEHRTATCKLITDVQSVRFRLLRCAGKIRNVAAVKSINH